MEFWRRQNASAMQLSPGGHCEHLATWLSAGGHCEHLGYTAVCWGTQNTLAMWLSAGGHNTFAMWLLENAEHLDSATGC